MTRSVFSRLLPRHFDRDVRRLGLTADERRRFESSISEQSDSDFRRAFPDVSAAAHRGGTQTSCLLELALLGWTIGFIAMKYVFAFPLHGALFFVPFAGVAFLHILVNSRVRRPSDRFVLRRLGHDICVQCGHMMRTSPHHETCAECGQEHSAMRFGDWSLSKETKTP